MNEPDPLNQHQVDEHNEGSCETCSGTGVFLEYHLRPIICPDCGGSGRYIDTVARTLSGERGI